MTALHFDPIDRVGSDEWCALRSELAARRPLSEINREIDAVDELDGMLSETAPEPRLTLNAVIRFKTLDGYDTMTERVADFETTYEALDYMRDNVLNPGWCYELVAADGFVVIPARWS